MVFRIEMKNSTKNNKKHDFYNFYFFHFFLEAFEEMIASNIDTDNLLFEDFFPNNNNNNMDDDKITSQDFAPWSQNLEDCDLAPETNYMINDDEWDNAIFTRAGDVMLGSGNVWLPATISHSSYVTKLEETNTLKRKSTSTMTNNTPVKRNKFNLQLRIQSNNAQQATTNNTVGQTLNTANICNEILDMQSGPVYPQYVSI